MEVLAPIPEVGEDMSFVSTAVVLVVGRSVIGAAVTVQDSFAEMNEDGRFEVSVALQEGANLIEIVASIAIGEEVRAVLLVAYEP